MVAILEPKKPMPRFKIGNVYATPGAMEVLDKEEGIALLFRHHCGDWGTVDAEDKQANEDALKHGARLLSAYTTKAGVKVWIITEADRSTTTILLPDEY